MSTGTWGTSEKIAAVVAARPSGLTNGASTRSPTIMKAIRDLRHRSLSQSGVELTSPTSDPVPPGLATASEEDLFDRDGPPRLRRWPVRSIVVRSTSVCRDRIQSPLAGGPPGQEPANGYMKYGVWPMVTKAFSPRFPGRFWMVQSWVDSES